MKKKHLLLLLLCLGSMSASAAIIDGTCGDELTWKLDSKTGLLTIEGTGAMTNWSSAAAVPWNEYHDYITEVAIPEGPANIGSYAFYGCSNLASINIPNSVTAIGRLAFSNCSNLVLVKLNSNAICRKNYSSSSRIRDIFGSQVTEYIIGNDVTEIGSFAFYQCKLRKITIGENVISIGESAFTSTELTSIIIPNSVQSIGAYAFYNQVKLASVTLGNSVQSIGESAFRNCNLLTSLTIPNNVTTIGNYAFLSCSSLTDLTIGSSVQSIGDEAFYGCSLLPSVVIPNSVQKIGKEAFKNCSGMAEVSIGNGVKSIGYNAFYYCSNLVSVFWNAKSCSSFSSCPFPAAKIMSFTFGEDVVTIPAYLCYKMTNITSIDIPNSVTTIEEYAFSGCSNVNEITIGNSVQNIGNYAFQNCSSLTGLTMGNSVQSISDYAFQNCSSLTELTMGNKVQSIGEYAFQNCSNLTDVTIGNGIQSIGTSAFTGCDVSSLTIAAATPPSGGINSGINNTACTLSVSAKSMNTYANTIWWEDFFEIKSYAGAVFTVQFNDHDGTPIVQQIVTDGEAATAPVVPGREGYTFTGWDKEFDNITQDIIVTAQYRINRFGVHFNDWNGTELKLDSVDYAGTAAAPADPVRTGHTFTGWDKAFDNVKADMTVTAQYTINYYDVFFLDHEGNVLKEQSVKYNTSAAAPTAPIREGYTFTGWSGNIENVSGRVFSVAQYKETKQEPNYTVNYEDKDGGIIASDKIRLNIPEAPSYDGYTFLYWKAVAMDINNILTVRAVYNNNNPTSDAPSKAEGKNVRKVMRDGVMYIVMPDGRMYDLQGAEVR